MSLQVTDKKNTQNLIVIMTVIIAFMFTVLVGLGWRMYDKLDSTSDKVVGMEVKFDMILSGKVIIPSRPLQSGLPDEEPQSNQKALVAWLAITKKENQYEKQKKESQRSYSK